jgi:hypothetical protein
MTRRVRTGSRFNNVLAVLVLLAIAAGVGWMYYRDNGNREPSPTATPSYDVARNQVEALPIWGWDPVRDFQRYRFGEAWSDDVNVEFGHNGCNTRDDILRRDLVDLQVRPGTCFAQSGVLHDPYTGATIDFVRGPDTSSTVQIDHVVSLADAWYTGARTWDDQRRRDFANDPRNLLAVGGQVNFDKAFRDVASWLPPNAPFRCAFVARAVEVKTAYQLAVSAKEKDAMRRVLRDC